MKLKKQISKFEIDYPENLSEKFREQHQIQLVSVYYFFTYGLFWDYFRNTIFRNQLGDHLCYREWR